MKIALLQTDIIWKRPEENLKHVSEIIQGLTSGTEMLVLPEMFSTGFCIDPSIELAAEGSKTVEAIKAMAVKSGIAICGSVIYYENKKIFNRFFAALPDGTVITYDKRHLFRMGDEHHVFTAGAKRVTFEYKGIRFLPQICYDLRFPVFSRNRNDYDVVIYVANWPALRYEPWRKLLMARGVENYSYCIGVNRVGTDGNGYEYSGNSMASDYNGTVLCESTERKEEILYADISMDKLANFRSKFPVWMDGDEFDLKL
jgi:predicted amidohydrolase